MSSAHSERVQVGPAKLHHIFPAYDPEIAAVMTILLGLFQVLLSVPMYFMTFSLHRLFLCPLCIGVMVVAAGSHTIACERSPHRQLMKGCAYTCIAGLLGALCALPVYCYVLGQPLSLPECSVTQHEDVDDPCQYKPFMVYFKSLSTLLMVYNIASLVLQSFLSYSVVKGLRGN